MRTPAKNNFICKSIVKRDKRTHDAGRSAGRYPGVGAADCVSVPTTLVSILSPGCTHYIAPTIVYTNTQSVE
jgi:hypothetical protein